MSPTHTDNLKTNLSEAGSHLKRAATDTADAVRDAASAAGAALSMRTSPVSRSMLSQASPPGRGMPT